MENINSSFFKDDETGTKMTFLFVAKTDLVINQAHFAWQSDDQNNMFRVNLPWQNGTIFIDHASRAGRLEVSGQTELTGSIESYFYERDGANARLYRSGVEIGNTTGLTAVMPETSGHFYLADDHTNANRTNMDFYALFFWNRILTDEEKQKLFLFAKKTFSTKKAANPATVIKPSLTHLYINDYLLNHAECHYQIDRATSS
ncbi:MAG: hypothetical protein J4F36_14675, partial [Nitrosopumilaceae archaeon]|nr:hypothetical protein [Nitrosopumilaceae archaeon]